LLVGFLVLLEYGTGNAAAVVDLNAAVFGPGADAGGLLPVAVRAWTAAVARCARLAGVRDEALKAVSYLLGVLGAYVDLIGVIAEAEQQGLLGVHIAVVQIAEQNYSYLLCHFVSF